jgi:RNA-directed DNA polymerase
MKIILHFSHADARRFLLKEESYYNFDLPKYFVFQKLLEQISQEIKEKPLSDYYGNYVDASSGKTKPTSPYDYENVNHRILNNKDGKFAWRPLQLVHPAIYVSLVHKISKEENWNLIVSKMEEFRSNSKIRCLSLPVESDDELSDKATTVSNWWHSVEQGSIELALKYQYVVHTDISDCYGSIYTHSIAWALHTREVAKKKKKDKNLIGNAIDSCIQDMSFGQTNGIPQGSVLMDFIAEIVLGYADLELSRKIHDKSIDDYEILRYRDDYRIFTNNPQDGDLILKLLTEILVDLGLKLNPQKTLASNHVIVNSIKQDKLDWIKSQKRITNLQGHLLLIHDFSCKHPNSGSLAKALDKFFARIKRLKNNRDDALVLISILVDIMFNNPRIYPIGAAILSKFLSLINSGDEKIKILNAVISKFRLLPNIGYLEIWIQRIVLKTEHEHEIDFNEPICKKLNDANVPLWNSEWLNNNKLKQLINNCSIVEREIIEEMDEVMEEKEVKLFGSKNIYL